MDHLVMQTNLQPQLPMDKNEVTLVVPVYNMGPFRFNNFCFLVKKLNNLGCGVIVVEQQSNRSGPVEQITVGLENVSHTVVEVGGDEFNKSKLINHAFKRVYTDFMWVVDGDFHTNFNDVMTQADSTSDLIIPFSEVLFLNKHESNTLHTSGNILLNHEEKYKTNHQAGKFSFIVRSSTFSSCKGMSEDFYGWGFQDLDFVENRLTGEEKQSRVQLRGYHMYHLPQSKDNIEINRKLYLNYKEVNLKQVVKDKLKEYVGQANQLSQRKTDLYTKKLKPTKNQEASVKTKIARRVVSKWNKPTFGILYSGNSKIYYPTNDVITIRDNTLVEYKRINGQQTKLSTKKHFLYYYMEYICHVYGMFSSNESVLFANDSFCKSHEHVKSFSRKLNDISKGNILNPDDSKFMYVHAEQNIKQGGNMKKFSPQGCFFVNSDLILKKKFDFYYNLYTKFGNMTNEQIGEYTPRIRSIFLDN
jgi:hypothetical protein